jgi:hypothetical protein
MLPPLCAAAGRTRRPAARHGALDVPDHARSTDWIATRIALQIARGGEPPWQMMVTPFTPSSGAPPYSV